jgi:hypothetical protein
MAQKQCQSSVHICELQSRLKSNEQNNVTVIVIRKYAPTIAIALKVQAHFLKEM